MNSLLLVMALAQGAASFFIRWPPPPFPFDRHILLGQAKANCTIMNKVGMALGQHDHKGPRDEQHDRFQLLVV
jgi:hypothetical protein